MTHLSLELIRTIRHDYEREAERIRLLKLAKASKRTLPFIKKLEGLGRDLTYLAYRLVTLNRKPA